MELQLEEVIGLFPKQSATELAVSLKDENGEWKSKDEILTALKNEQKKTLDTVAKGESGKAVRLRMKQAQNYIKENWGIESDANEIEDHLKLLVETVQGKAGKEKIVEKVVDLNEETALQNPIVKKLITAEVGKATSDYQRKYEEKEREFKSYIEQDKLRKLNSKLISEATRVLKANKAALDKDEAIQARQIKRFVAGLQSEIKFKLDENDNPIPVDENGDPLQEGYVEISFADLIKRENIFGVHNYDPDKDSAGAVTRTPQQQRLNVPVPTDLASFKEAMANEKDPAKKKAILEAYTAAQSK